MSDVHSGSCLCGEVRFEIRGHFEHFFLCHCGRCRKGSGSAHAANLFSTSASIKWLSGEASVRTFRLPGTRHERCFCSSCGAAVPSIQMNCGLLVVPAGSLDSPVEIRPDAHICVASSANWDRQWKTFPALTACLADFAISPFRRITGAPLSRYGPKLEGPRRDSGSSEACEPDRATRGDARHIRTAERRKRRESRSRRARRASTHDALHFHITGPAPQRVR